MFTKRTCFIWFMLIIIQKSSYFVAHAPQTQTQQPYLSFNTYFPSLDQQQKKQVIRVLVAGICIMVGTGILIWFAWVRPLQKKIVEFSQKATDPCNAQEEFQNMEDLYANEAASCTLKEGETLQRIVRNGKDKWLYNLMRSSSNEELSKT